MVDERVVAIVRVYLVCARTRIPTHTQVFALGAHRSDCRCHAHAHTNTHGWMGRRERRRRLLPLHARIARSLAHAGTQSVGSVPRLYFTTASVSVGRRGNIAGMRTTNRSPLPPRLLLGIRRVL